MTAETSHERGVWGEEQVALYLAERGHCLIETRWRCQFGELDLITQQEGFLCFVEVKLRKCDNPSPARAFVTPAKQRKLRITAELYLSLHPTSLQPRLDVAEIYAPKGKQTQHPKIIYWENAF